MKNKGKLRKQIGDESNPEPNAMWNPELDHGTYETIEENYEC